MNWTIAFFSLVVVLISVPFFITVQYYLGVIIVILMNILMATSIWLILMTGQASLGHAAFSAIGGYVSAAFVSSYGFSFWPSLLIAIVTTAIIALFIGSITLRIKSHYFIIVTAAFGEIVRIVFSMIERPFGGLIGILNLPPPDPIGIPGLLVIDFHSKVAYYYLTVVLTMVCIVILHRIHNSRIGLILRSIDQADKLSESVGINIMRYKVLSFVIGSSIAGLAGVLYAFNARSMLPVSFTFWNSIYALIYASVGGLTTIAGPILGATVFTVLSEVLRPAQMFEPVIFGLVLIVFMMFFKNGLLGAVNIVIHTMMRWIYTFGFRNEGGYSQ